MSSSRGNSSSTRGGTSSRGRGGKRQLPPRMDRLVKNSLLFGIYVLLFLQLTLKLEFMFFLYRYRPSVL